MSISYKKVIMTGLVGGFLGGAVELYVPDSFYIVK